ADDVTRRDEPWDLVVRNAAEERDAWPLLERVAQRAVARKRERALAEPRERVGETNDVLALLERADAEKARCAVGHRLDREALEVDAARHDLGLADRTRDFRLELATEVFGHADHCGRTTNDECRRRADAWQPADVPHVAAVRRDDERRARTERRDQ